MKIRLEIDGKNAGSLSYKGPDSAELAVTYLNSIEADEVQIYLVRDDGTKAFAEFSGEFWSMSATKFILSASKNKQAPELSTSSDEFHQESLTLKERLEMFLRFEYPRVWFTSLDVKRQYERVYGKINLSTVSTYLARMYRDNILERKGNHNQREYRFKDETNPLMNMEYASEK
ncbi:hypothetical protein ANME2D_03344 [Candidatus Methanoperedens nitroreducens]|uniref:Uncharacterized protein n=1 Tax=Candidatus Methanoperedens nitratireducens TaxID=1392998 RepID=A0A062V3R7_9EURY|nr:hypothetical protein [Candidatus Methanoperedens nitroreducens]KCZ70429.1 hypothetical protein ANME2D_03344 [Candidatus Methanoperedens nitroreducens]MDJ1420868.1 hypothetical protein [Candidatus Methanoperedens sp.]